MSQPVFHGVEIALITRNNKVVLMLRDDKPDLQDRLKENLRTDKQQG